MWKNCGSILGMHGGYWLRLSGLSKQLYCRVAIPIIIGTLEWYIFIKVIIRPFYVLCLVTGCSMFPLA